MLQFYVSESTVLGWTSGNAEVRKPKYGSENKSRLGVFSALLTREFAL